MAQREGETTFIIVLFSVFTPRATVLSRDPPGVFGTLSSPREQRGEGVPPGVIFLVRSRSPSL